MLSTIMDIHKQRWDEFFQIKDEKLNDLVLYNNFGSL